MSKNAVINLLNLPLSCQVTLSKGGFVQSHMKTQLKSGTGPPLGVISYILAKMIIL
jgi:hypothetical protein